MFAVLFDTNTVMRDVWLSSSPARALLELAADQSCKVICTEVVVEELRRQQLDKVKQLRAEAQSLSHGLLEQFEEAIELLTSRVGDNFNELLARPGIVHQPVPADATARLVRRDLERRRPFLETGANNKSAGFRDAVIWESVLELFRGDTEYTKVFFVTKDEGFKEEHGLHAHLLEDLDALPVDRDCVVRVNSLFDAVSQIRALLEATAAAERQARLSAVAADAVFALVGESVSEEMGYGGDYAYPDFVKFSPGSLEDATIEDFDQATEFEFVTDEGASTVTASAEFELFLEGFIFKSDWLADDSDRFGSITDWNKHYFQTSTGIPVRAVVEIDTSGKVPEAVSVELHDIE